MARSEDPQVGLGKAIRQLRTSRALSQEDLSDLSDVHSTWISHYESGRINPSWGNMRRVATALGVSLAELAALSEELEPRSE